MVVDNKHWHISFCTVCMNRLHHLKETLLQNIIDNLNYPDLQHILLDYNSTDGMEEWVKDNLSEHIANGRLIYYHAIDQISFHRTHSRNMAFLMAKEGIVCNIDADNYTGAEFAQYIDAHFRKYPESYLAVDYMNYYGKYKDSYGRIACQKKHFLALRGFDEAMSGYGYEDIDFCERLARSGLKPYYISEEKFLKSISHSHDDRQKNEAHSGKFDREYLQQVDPFKSRIIFLFKDHTFSRATILDRMEGFGNPTLEEKDWIRGTWTYVDNKLILQSAKKPEDVLRISPGGDLIDPDGNTYYLIQDDNFRKELEMNYSILTNHQRVLNNRDNKLIQVNSAKFGQGRVIKNFTEEFEI